MGNKNKSSGKGPHERRKGSMEQVFQAFFGGIPTHCFLPGRALTTGYFCYPPYLAWVLGTTQQ